MMELAASSSTAKASERRGLRVLKRALMGFDFVEFAPHITMTNADFRFIVGEQLQEVGIDPGPILIELEGRNTAPAILASSIFASERDADAVLLVAPSDHIVPDVVAFHDALKRGLDAVSSGRIVTFGIKPTRPETGYGNLEVSETTKDEPVDLVRFIEKPDFLHAQEMLHEGKYQ